MANLIITIIAIALVAVAAIMGAYYGSNAYSTASIKATAAHIISVMEQIKRAALVWQTNNMGAYYPTIDPTGAVASCEADNNSVMECWSNTLPYNNQYLHGITSTETYTGLSGNTRGVAGDFATDISYGAFGIHKTDVDNGFNSAFIKIQSMPSGWPNSNPKWYVRWFITLGSYATYHTSGTPTQLEAQLYIANLCHELNRQMGYERPDGSYPGLPLDTAGATITMNTNIQTGSSTAFNLPYTADGAANLCTMAQAGSNLNQMNFLIPIY